MEQTLSLGLFLTNCKCITSPCIICYQPIVRQIPKESVSMYKYNKTMCLFSASTRCLYSSPVCVRSTNLNFVDLIIFLSFSSSSLGTQINNTLKGNFHNFGVVVICVTPLSGSGFFILYSLQKPLFHCTWSQSFNESG